MGNDIATELLILGTWLQDMGHGEEAGTARMAASRIAYLESAIERMSGIPLPGEAAPALTVQSSIPHQDGAGGADLCNVLVVSNAVFDCG